MQKFSQADMIMNKASEVAVEAKRAEVRAEELKRQAMLECDMSSFACKKETKCSSQCNCGCQKH